MSMERVTRAKPLTRFERLQHKFWWALRIRLSVPAVHLLCWNKEHWLTKLIYWKLYISVCNKECRVSFAQSQCLDCGEIRCAPWCVHYSQWRPLEPTRVPSGGKSKSS